MHPFFQSALGGALIGVAAWLLLLGLGRVAGISGIVGAALAPHKGEAAGNSWRWTFIVALMGVGALLQWGHPALSQGQVRPAPLLVLAGLLVGYGTVLGSGCTSGHGVCGLGRMSARSLVATLTFMAAGMLTASALLNR